MYGAAGLAWASLGSKMIEVYRIVENIELSPR
jgi:hypothetical protein